MAELPLLARLNRLVAGDNNERLIDLLNTNFEMLTRDLEHLRKAVPLRVSVNGTVIAAVTDINIVAGSGVHITGVYDTTSQVLTLTITSP